MPADFQPRPEVGDILVVIHDFLARSSDELSLAKGDRVELIERDDEFGDGWFLGRHMVNGNTGLFPEVYTRPAPKGVTSTVSALRPLQSTFSSSTNGSTTDQNGRSHPTLFSNDGRPATSHTISSSKSSKSDSKPLSLQPLTTPKSENKPISTPPSAFSAAKGYGGINHLTSQSQESPVLHETLTVIDEHMNDLHSQPSNGALNNATDSGSEYSNQLHDRLSYIQGEETDEEEEVSHTRAEVEAWSADNVAEYLFTAGVEKKHCEVFRDQEISGEVLLGMDQSSLFLKAFDLGSVGRRLKTWQKIKSLQDEVNGLGHDLSRKSDAGSEGSKRMRSRNNTLTQNNRSRSGSVQAKRLSQSTPKIDPISPITPVSPITHDSPTQPNHQKRPSAASVRDLHHSRRHSSTDYRLTGTTFMSSTTPKIPHSGIFPLGDAAASAPAHKKQPSFDRNWTMGNASSSPPSQQRPLSSAGLHVLNNSEENLASDTADLERGYFSGTDADGRNRRNVLKKRSDSLANHSHKGSYTEEQRLRSATSISRHSRFGSMDSTANPPSAAAKYYGLAGSHKRTNSTNTTESIHPVLSKSKDAPFPTVTKLDNGEVEVSPISPSNRQAIHPDWLAKSAKLSGFGSLRAISDAVTGMERAKLASPSEASLKDSPMRSPSRTGSSTPSAGPSFELDSPDTAKSPLSATTVGSQTTRKPKTKSKKETSAYQRGLQKISPREAVKDADYSGWMKKKNSHIMTTWKPRLFILKGRRLSYYYSEDDAEEQGLIDISFHRVLPADNERLTGLHATLTGASNTPIMPADSNLQTGADTPSAADVVEKGNDTMFIFKLVPPRAGLSRAVNFTKPTVHYFAVPNLNQGRMWMAALMKATIDRDDTKPMTSTYQQKTISLAKARQMRHRPPALMNLDEKVEEGPKHDNDEKKNGLGISFGEVDSAISGMEKLGLQKIESANAQHTSFNEKGSSMPSFMMSPQSA